MLLTKQTHSFHLVDPSPWPIITAFSAFITTFGGVLKMHGYILGTFVFQFGFFLLVLAAAFWWGNVIREGTFEGQHTKKVKKGILVGMLLFIFSEVWFFFAFFFAFFYFSLNPSHAIGGIDLLFYMKL